MQYGISRKALMTVAGTFPVKEVVLGAKRKMKRAQHIQLDSWDSVLGKQFHAGAAGRMSPVSQEQLCITAAQPHTESGALPGGPAARSLQSH